MRRWFWIDGRFSWLFVTAVVFLTLLFLTADFAWRVLVIPFETLAIATVLVGVSCVIFSTGLYVLLHLKKTSG